MRIAFDPASPARLARFGLGLPFTAPVDFTAEFAAEPPCHVAAAIDPRRPLRIGAFTSIAGGRLRHVTIGRYCTLADGVQTGWESPAEAWATTSALAQPGDPHGWARLLGHDARQVPDPYPPARQATTIGHDVWIGQGAFLAPGITIGNGAVIAARAEVLADVAPYAVVAGSPAQPVHMRFPPATVARLQKSAWWRFNLLHLPPALLADPEAFLDHVEAAAATGALAPYEPGWHGPDDLAGLLHG
jgi:acetyltransferase-like isoleucine patch superfamily enzyme